MFGGLQILAHSVLTIIPSHSEPQLFFYKWEQWRKKNWIICPCRWRCCDLNPGSFCSRVRVLSSCNVLLFSWMCCHFGTPMSLLAWGALSHGDLSSRQSPLQVSKILLLGPSSPPSPTLCCPLGWHNQRVLNREFLKSYFNFTVDGWELVFSSLYLIANSLKKKRKKKVLLYSPQLQLKCNNMFNAQCVFIY